MAEEETRPVLRKGSASYGTEGKTDDPEIIVPEESPEVQAAFFSSPANSILEYCCRGKLTKIILVLFILTVFFFLCTVVLLTMVIMYSTYQFGCPGPSTGSTTASSAL